MTMQDTAPDGRIRRFSRAEAPMTVMRKVGRGFQQYHDWLGPEAPFRAGIAELGHIRVSDYDFPCDDFLYVLEGETIITNADGPFTLRPGEANFIRADKPISREVPERVLWLYASMTDITDWSDVSGAPAVVREV